MKSNDRLWFFLIFVFGAIALMLSWGTITQTSQLKQKTHSGAFTGAKHRMPTDYSPSSLKEMRDFAFEGKNKNK